MTKIASRGSCSLRPSAKSSLVFFFGWGLCACICWFFSLFFLASRHVFQPTSTVMRLDAGCWDPSSAGSRRLTKRCPDDAARLQLESFCSLQVSRALWAHLHHFCMLVLLELIRCLADQLHWLYSSSFRCAQVYLPTIVGGNFRRRKYRFRSSNETYPAP